VNEVVKLARLLALAAALFGTSSPARAHPEWVPTLVSRYLTLVIQEDRIDVSIVYLFGDLPARERRRQMDADGDGTISAQELVRERLSWARQAADLFRLFVDDRPAVLDPVVVIDLAGHEQVGARPLLVEMGGSVPLAPGTRRLRVEPGQDPPRLGETEITLDPGPWWRLLASRQGRGDETRPGQLGYKFMGPRVSSMEDRSVTFVIEAEKGASARARLVGPGGPLLAAALIAAAGAAGALALRWRQRRRQRNQV
jgi:hypothetical protein